MTPAKRPNRKRGQRCYVYKVVVDNGGAPCVYRNKLSLAICKPVIRRTATRGDLIFGFGSNSDEIANRLIYIAEITEKSTAGNYYCETRFEKRPDCIYRWSDEGRLVLRDDAKFHNFPGAMERDVGRYPKYGNANVLLSNDFRYFGHAATDEWKREYTAIRSLVEGMGQGHRVHHEPTLRAELLELKDNVWQEYPKVKLGEPLHARTMTVCHSAPCGEDEMIEVTESGCGQL